MTPEQFRAKLKEVLNSLGLNRIKNENGKSLQISQEPLPGTQEKVGFVCADYVYMGFPFLQKRLPEASLRILAWTHPTGWPSSGHAIIEIQFETDYYVYDVRSNTLSGPYPGSTEARDAVRSMDPREQAFPRMYPDGRGPDAKIWETTDPFIGVGLPWFHRWELRRQVWERMKAGGISDEQIREMCPTDALLLPATRGQIFWNLLFYPFGL